MGGIIPEPARKIMIKLNPKAKTIF